MVKSSFVFFTEFHLPPPNSMIFGIMRIIIISKERMETQRTQVLGRKVSWPWSCFHVSSPTCSLSPVPQEGGRLPAHWRQNLPEPLSARGRCPWCSKHQLQWLTKWRTGLMELLSPCPVLLSPFRDGDKQGRPRACWKHRLWGQTAWICSPGLPCPVVWS